MTENKRTEGCWSKDFAWSNETKWPVFSTNLQQFENVECQIIDNFSELVVTNLIIILTNN